MGKVIAIDSMIMVYIVEGHEEFQDTCLKIVDSAEKVIASYLVKGEILAGYKLGEEEKRAHYFANFEKRCEKMEYKEFGDKTAFLFSELRKKYPNIGRADCIHLATAIEHNADSFITNDKQLKQVEEIPIILLTEKG